MEGRKEKTLKTLLLVFNGTLVAIGTCGGPLVMRLYFLHGGARIWLLSWLQTAGFPIIIIPLVITYSQRRATKGSSSKLFYMKPFLFVASAFIGVLIGLDNYLYAYGLSRLPVSTSSLIISSQLAFTAGFSFLLVKQKFTFYSINAVFLLCIGAGMLALRTSGDRPEGETDKEYIIGFLMTVGAAALYGLLLPLIELMYKKSKQVITYTLVLEIQLVFSLFATGFCTVGMLINRDFQAITREAKNYTIGEAKYYLVLVSNAISGQFFYLGVVGIIFYASSLLSGVVVVALLPLTEILAVLFFKEPFIAEKGVSLALSLWGFISYYVGEFKNNKKPQSLPETEMNQSSLP